METRAGWETLAVEMYSGKDCTEECMYIYIYIYICSSLIVLRGRLRADMSEQRSMYRWCMSLFFFLGRVLLGSCTSAKIRLLEVHEMFTRKMRF